MKQKLLFILVAMVCSTTSWANDNLDDFPSIDLTFTAVGDTNTVETVTVTNISHPEIEPITINGTDILRLVSADIYTPIESIEEAKGIAQPILTPNPAMGDGTLIFDAKEEGPVRISIYNQGGMLLDAATLNVSKGRNTARIPAQGTGIFIVNIDGQGVKTSTRWICAGSKSFSGIALGGAGQWADVVLPMKFEAPTRTTRAAQVREKFMEYNEGDILRFDGRTGELRTIMHMTPRVSGSVCIDLFRCQDANGYNYPIIRSGNMLWMMEDLRPVAMPGITRTGMVTQWKSKVSTEPVVFVSQGRAYYNLQAARMALPEGWHLPSVDELRSYIRDGLHTSVYSPDEETPAFTAYGVTDFLKDRSYNWGYLYSGPDSIHMQLRPNGYVDANGKVLQNGETGAWLLRNTIKHGYPATFEVSKEHHRFDFAVEHEKDMGFTVRGCCPAPTEYEAIIGNFFSDPSENADPPMLAVSGPLGKYYTFGPDRFSVFVDFGGVSFPEDDHPMCEKRSAILNKELKDDDSEGWVCQKRQFVPLDVNGADQMNHLRKVTSQVNAYGYENVVYASWSQPFRVHLSPTISGSEGVVYVSIFGDAEHNHEMLVNKAPLLDADGSEYIWQMPTSGRSSDAPWTLELPKGYYLSDFLYQHYARAFNINCIQDMTGDGVAEIVMNVGHTIAIFDGVTLRRIHQRSNFKSVCTRFDVADVTGDGYEDIVVATSDANNYTWMYIYDKGDIDQNPIYYQKTQIHSRYCDIKVGHMSGNKMPEIAILMRGGTNNSNGTLNTINYYGHLEVLRMYYDGNNQIQANQILLTKVDCFTDRVLVPDLRGLTGNMNLVFGYFRGHSYPQDLIVGNGLWRWDESQGKPVYQFQMLPETRVDYALDGTSYVFGSTISADAIVAVQTAKNDKESLMFFLDRYPYASRSAIPHSSATLVERWLADDGKTVKTNWSLGSSLCGWGNHQCTRIMRSGDGLENLAHPVICKFADRDMTKYFEYVGHEQSLCDPIITAVVAAAPYYASAGPGSANTSWGKTAKASDSEIKSDTWGGSVIVGYEYEFSMPFFSSVNAGVEFTSKVGASYSTASGVETAVSYGYSFQAEAEHQVLLRATLYDTYTYRVVDSGDPDDLGMTFRVSMPRSSDYISLNLQDYVLLMGNRWDVAKPQRVLTSTPGDPWSYPNNYNGFPYAITDNKDDFPFLKGRVDNSETGQWVGSGTATRSISLEKYVSETKTVEFNIETELVGKAAGAKAGVGFNYGNSKETTRTIGSQLSVEGTVPGLPSVASSEYKSFHWNLVWYYVNDDGHIYPVVNYIVY